VHSFDSISKLLSVFNTLQTSHREVNIALFHLSFGVMAIVLCVGRKINQLVSTTVTVQRQFTFSGINSIMSFSYLFNNPPSFLNTLFY
jgi:hypothetical protein